jgi:hypothetical protein
MIPADVDPSLRSGAPAPERLDDGFSPPPAPGQPAGRADAREPAAAALGPKSPF